MKIPTVDRCCCGCSLYGGALFIATFVTTAVFLSLINVLAGGSSSESMIHGLIIITDNNQTVEVNVTEINEVVHLMRPVFQVVDGMMAVRYLILLVICLCLVYGIVKRSACYVLPFLITNIFLTISDIITFIGVAILIMMVYSVGMGFVLLFLILLANVLNFYLLIVIYSYYMQVKTPPHYAGPGNQEYNYNA